MLAISVSTSLVSPHELSSFSRACNALLQSQDCAAFTRVGAGFAEQWWVANAREPIGHIECATRAILIESTGVTDVAVRLNDVAKKNINRSRKRMSDWEAVSW